MTSAAAMGKQTGAIIAVVLCVVFLGIAINRLVSDEELVHKIDRLAQAMELHEGDSLPEMEVPVLFPQRGKMTMPLKEGDMLVMFYSGRCSLCKDAWQVWNGLASCLEKREDVHTIALSVLDEAATLKDLTTHATRSKVGLFVLSASTQAYKVFRLPMIVHIKSGKVAAAYLGPIGREQEQAIMKRLNGGAEGNRD